MTPSPKTLSAGCRSTRVLLEYESERAGTFEPLRLVPRGKSRGVAWLAASCRDGVVGRSRQRIDEAAKYVPLENLAISRRNALASTMEGTC